MTTYRAKIQWVQSADLLVDALNEDDAKKQIADLLKQSTVIWNSNWKTDIVRVDSIDMDMSYLDALLEDIAASRLKCKCDGDCGCGAEVTD